MKTLKRIFPKLFPILGLIYFGWSAFGAPRGVSYDSATTNVYQITHQKFHSITNLASTAGEIALHNAEEKLVSTNAAGVRGILSVPVFDLTDPGAVNIFPFWDDTGNEVDWTSNTALLTLLGLDSNDDVTFGTVTATTVTATTLVGAGGGITYNGAGNNGNLATSINTLQELNDAVDNLSLGGGGSAPVGTVVGSGTSTQYAIPFYSDATSTNIEPSLITTDSTKTNLNVGGVNANVMVVTNLAQTLSNLGLGTEDTPNFTNVTVGTTNLMETLNNLAPKAAPIFTGNITVGSTAGSATLTAGQINLNTTAKQIGIHNGTREVAIPLSFSKEISFDPDAVCDGAVDRLFLFTVGAWAPNGITITRWRCSFEADPTTEVDLDLKRADAFIGVANAAVMDVLDTTAGASTETTAANINGGAVVATGKVVYLEFGTAYTEANHQIIFELEYEIEED